LIKASLSKNTNTKLPLISLGKLGTRSLSVPKYQSPQYFLNFIAKSKNYGDYQHIDSPKNGGPFSLNFASRLRMPDEFSAKNLKKSSPKNCRETMFSFYSKDIEKWNEKIKRNIECERHKFKGLEIGPSINCVLKLFDADVKGNTGLVFL